jgi:hypothetical protein
MARLLLQIGNLLLLLGLHNNQLTTLGPHTDGLA